MQREGRAAGEKERQEYSASVEEETGSKARRDTSVDSWRNGGGQRLTANSRRRTEERKKNTTRAEGRVGEEKRQQI